MNFWDNFGVLVITKIGFWDKADFTPRTQCTYLRYKFAKSLLSQRFHANDKRLYVFALTTFVLKLIFSMRWDSRRDTQSVKSARSILHAEFEARVLTLYIGTKKHVTWTQTRLILSFIVTYLELPQFLIWSCLWQ